VASGCIIAPELRHGYVFRPSGGPYCGAGIIIWPRPALAYSWDVRRQDRFGKVSWPASS
jgi:hypothetical protein